MEISERFSYHSQILESMVTKGVVKGAAVKQTSSSGLGLPRVPVSSSSLEREEAGSGEKLVSKGGSNGDLHVDSPKFSIGDHSRSPSPSFTDSDEQTDAAGASVSRTKSLR